MSEYSGTGDDFYNADGTLKTGLGKLVVDGLSRGEGPKICIRKFATGATRDTEEGKNDYEGFLSPLVIQRYGDYMTKHRVQKDGSVRDSDNWQKGMPLAAYIKSAWRHFLVCWKFHRGVGDQSTDGSLEDALCALLFNVHGYLHTILRDQYSPVSKRFQPTEKFADQTNQHDN